MGNAPPYFLRLRIYAKQINYFYRKLRALPPVYDNCPIRCIAPEADRQNGCPDCDFTIFYKKFKSNYYRIVEKEITRDLIEAGVEREKAIELAKEDTEATWTFENLRDDYRVLSELEARAGVETEDTPGGYSPDWNIRVKFGIDVIREERYKVRREIEYEHKENAQAKARAKRRRLNG